MPSKEDYYKRVMILGQYCYPERAEETTSLVMASLKSVLPEGPVRDIRELLPEPLRGLWEDASLSGKVDEGETDCITLAKNLGNYPYRAAAERAFEVILASIREAVDDKSVEKIREMLPLSVRPIFEKAKSCAVDGSAGDFL